MTAGSPKEDWETVHTVHDYWDGPRTGVADCGGVPHAYACEWSEEDDDWSNVFRLSPIRPDQLLKVMESWALWLRWRHAHDTGRLGRGDDHPALAVDRPRYEALRRDVDEALKVAAPPAVRATAEFRGDMDPARDLQVRWFPL